MAENKDGTEKSEQPSPKRLQEARRKGQVATTRDLSPVVVLFGGVGLLTLWAPTAWRHFQHQSQSWFELAGTLTLDPNTAYALFSGISEHIFLPLLPFPLIMAALAVGAMLIQTGPLWVEDVFRLKPSKMNPVNGLKRVVSLRGVVELSKSLMKVGLVVIIVYLVISGDLKQLVQLSTLSTGDALSATWTIAIKIVLWAGFFFLILALADLMYQRWQFSRDMRMTKQEVKEESKDIEGDPLIRSRRLSLQRERSRQRMMQAVPKADVVITNPTHVAVAVRYEAGTMDAPTVVAKGAGVLAEKIKQIARRAGVPIIENRSLARGLYRTVKIGQEIPADLYRAAAEVLAFIYRLRHGNEKAS